MCFVLLLSMREQVTLLTPGLIDLNVHVLKRIQPSPLELLKLKVSFYLLYRAEW